MKNCLAQNRFIVLFFESYQNKVLTDNNRSLDQHSVGCQQFVLFFLAHIRKTVFDIILAVNLSAGVEKPFQRKTASLMPFF